MKKHGTIEIEDIGSVNIKKITIWSGEPSESEGLWCPGSDCKETKPQEIYLQYDVFDALAEKLSHYNN